MNILYQKEDVVAAARYYERHSNLTFKQSIRFILDKVKTAKHYAKDDPCYWTSGGGVIVVFDWYSNNVVRAHIGISPTMKYPHVMANYGRKH